MNDEFPCAVCGCKSTRVFIPQNMKLVEAHVKGGKTDQWPMRTLMSDKHIEGGEDVTFELADGTLRTERVGGTIVRKPVVWESPTDRKKWMEARGYIDAVTPEAEKPTMYEDSDVDFEAYKKSESEKIFDKYGVDTSKLQPRGEFVEESSLSL